MKMSWFVGLLMVAGLSVGCEVTHGKSIPNTHDLIKVELLTEFDGIKLYRVETNSSYVYVASKSDKTLQTTRFVSNEDGGQIRYDVLAPAK